MIKSKLIGEIPQDCHSKMVTLYQSARSGTDVSCELQTGQSDMHGVQFT